MIIPIADQHLDYAHKVAAELKSEGIRVEVDERSERMNLKIREAQLQKIPYMLIVGDEEIGSSTVSVRLRSGKTLKAQSLPQFKERIKSEVEKKTEVV